jgi:hypothetical protein
MAIGLGYLVVALVFFGLWARVIFALRAGLPFVGLGYGMPVATVAALAVLVIASLVVIAVAVAHLMAAFRRRRLGAKS